MVRLLLIAAYLAVSLLGLSAIGLFMSTLTDVPVGAMAATVVLVGRLAGPGRAAATGVAASLAVQPLLAGLRAICSASRSSWDSFAANALLQGGYVAVFGALAYGRFITKDVLS